MKDSVALLFTVLILASLLFPPPLYAFHQKDEMGRGHENKNFFNPMADQLKLSKEQKEQIRIILKKQRAEIDPLENQLNDIRGKLRYLWLEPTPDPIKIEAARRESQVIRKQINDIRSRHRDLIYRHLTLEQQMKLQKYEEKRRYGAGKFRRLRDKGMESDLIQHRMRY